MAKPRHKVLESAGFSSRCIGHCETEFGKVGSLFHAVRSLPALYLKLILDVWSNPMR